MCVYSSKIITPQKNTLDSFVIKKAPKKYFDDDVALKDESNKSLSSSKRTQGAIDDYMYKDTKPLVKRFKK